MKVYIHHRCDNGHPFYVGITSNNTRPYTKQGRNGAWYEIVKQTEFTVEILNEDFEYIDALKKEISLIKEFGTLWSGGTLTNMQPGNTGEVRRHEQRKK